MISLFQPIMKALFLPAGHLTKWGSVGLVQTILMITRVWKHCRGCRRQSYLLQQDVSGVPPTVTRIIQKKGLDSTVWPEAFERLEQFIKDTGLGLDDLDMNYDSVVEMYQSGRLAMYFGSSSGVKMFQDQGINTTFLPFFQENGEKWLMTTPYFQVALNRDLTQNETRRQKAMKVLDTMLSEDAQNRIIYDGQDLLSYSQDVDLHLTEYLKDVKPVIEENHMYIRIASNDFFSVSRDVVSKMISGEYDAEQAYRSFNSQLLEEKSTSENIVLDSQKSYSNRFHSSGGNAAYSVMANTLRGIYGADVLIAAGNSFTGNVLKAGYTEK